MGPQDRLFYKMYSWNMLPLEKQGVKVLSKSLPLLREVLSFKAGRVWVV